MDRDNNATILLSTLLWILWMMSSYQWFKCIPDLQHHLLRYQTQLSWDSRMLTTTFKPLDKREDLKL